MKDNIIFERNYHLPRLRSNQKELKNLSIMETIKNGQFLSAESIISVHFNDEIKPTKLQYSFDHEGKQIFLAEYGCDANDLADIKEMAISEPYYEKAEGFYQHTYYVKNSSLGTPFENVDAILENN